VATLAEKFGWSERYILYELPLSRALQYFHCLQAANPMVWTVEVDRGTREPVAMLQSEEIERMLAVDAEIDLSE
jgi:hypothetical protein